MTGYHADLTEYSVLTAGFGLQTSRGPSDRVPEDVDSYVYAIDRLFKHGLSVDDNVSVAYAPEKDVLRIYANTTDDLERAVNAISQGSRMPTMIETTQSDW